MPGARRTPRPGLTTQQPKHWPGSFPAITVLVEVTGNVVYRPPPCTVAAALPVSLFAESTLSTRVSAGMVGGPPSKLLFQIPPPCAKPPGASTAALLSTTTVFSSVRRPKFWTPPPCANAGPLADAAVTVFRAITLSRTVTPPPDAAPRPPPDAATRPSGAVAVTAFARIRV